MAREYETYRKSLIGTTTKPLSRTKWSAQQSSTGQKIEKIKAAREDRKQGIVPVAKVDPLRDVREKIKAARKLGAERGLTGGAQNVFEKLETGQTEAIKGVDPAIIAQAQAARTLPPVTTPPTTPPPVVTPPTTEAPPDAGTPPDAETPPYTEVPPEEVPEVPTPELAPVFGETPPTKELGPRFDREYFDPLALYTERAAKDQLERVEEFKKSQAKLTGEAAIARDLALEQRRDSAEGKRAAERSVTGLEQQALLSQIERSKRASFNQLRGQLAQMGAYGTTGSGELDFAVLGEIYEGKSMDVRVAANKGLRDIEVAYFQIRDSIESDQSKSDIEKARSLQQLNERTHTEWQSIQQGKQESITKLAKEAFGVGVEEEKRVRDQAFDLVKRTLDSGQPVSSALLEEAGYKGTQVTVAKEIMGKEANAQSAARRLDWINSSVMQDFNIDETVIRQAANLLGTPYEELLADAQKWASAARYEFQSKQKGTGGGGDEGIKWLKGESFKGTDGQMYVRYQEAGGNRSQVRNAVTNELVGRTETGDITGVIDSLREGGDATLGGFIPSVGRILGKPPLEFKKMATELREGTEETFDVSSYREKRRKKLEEEGKI